MGLYNSLLLIAGIISFMFGCVLFSERGPKGYTFKYFRIARTLIATTYILYSALIAIAYYDHFRMDKPNTGVSISLCFYMVTAHLMALAYIVLINHNYINKEKLHEKGIRISIFIIITILCGIFLKGTILKIALFIQSIYFILEIINILVVFLKIYLPIRNEYDNNSSEENNAYVRWMAPSGLTLFATGLLSGIICILTIINSNVFTFVQIFLIATILNYYFIYVEFHNYGLNLPIFINESKQKGESVSYSRLKLMISEWIEQKGWLENGLTTDILASRLGSNRKYITKYFAEEQGGSFRSFINGKRIEESKILLSTTELSIDEIAAQIGYSSRNQFATLFKTSEEISPTQWREKNKLEKS